MQQEQKDLWSKPQSIFVPDKQIPSHSTCLFCVKDMKRLTKYLSSDEREDVHLASVGMLHRWDNEAGSTQSDLTFWPAVHGQCQLPFPHVKHPGQLHALRTSHTTRFTCGGKEDSMTFLLLFALWDFVNQLSLNGLLFHKVRAAWLCKRTVAQ